MRWTLTCRGSDHNNGIKRVHLVQDVYEDNHSQSEEFLINTRQDKFKEGDVWDVNFTLVSRKGGNQ